MFTPDESRLVTLLQLTVTFIFSYLDIDRLDIPSPCLPDVCTEGCEKEQETHVKVLDDMRQLRVPESLQPAHQSRDTAVHTTQSLNGTAVVNQITQAFLCFNHH